MTEAVIVATGRTPIGRANKGSLVDCRPDDLSALIIDAVMAKVPSLDPAAVEDVIWGCGQPAGEGDVFISGGVETVSRFQYGAADTGSPNQKFSAAHERTKLREQGGQPSW